MQSASNLLDDDYDPSTTSEANNVQALFRSLQVNGNSSSTLLDPLAGEEYESDDDDSACSVPTRINICHCKPWLISRSRELCPDLRKCEYVRNVQAVQRLRDQPSRQLCFTCSPSDFIDNSSSLNSSPSSTSIDDSQLSCSNCPYHFTLYIPQSSSTMNDGVGWTNHGGGDATGNVIWAAAIFTCKLLHAFKKRQLQHQMRSTFGTSHPPTLQFTSTSSSSTITAAASLPFFNSHAVTSLELGCGSALITLYLSLISHPRAQLLASDQNTKVVKDLQHRIAIGVEKGGWLPLEKEGELSSHVEENFQAPCSSEDQCVQLAAQLKHRLQRVKVLEYEWNEPLLTTPSLSLVRGETASDVTGPPSLIIGSDILYFSISYSKLCMTIWELFENALFEAKKPIVQEESTPTSSQISSSTRREFRSVIHRSMKDVTGSEQYQQYVPLFGEEVEVYTAESDPQQRMLVRASKLQKFKCTINQIGMYMARHREVIDGIFQSTKPIEHPDRIMKANGYFLTIDACQEFKIWLQNHPKAHSNTEQTLVSWMNKKPRVAAPTQSDSSSSLGVPPLLLLTQKCRHAETEQDFWLAISNFAHVYQVKPSFIHQLQRQTQKSDDQMNEAAAPNTATSATAESTSTLPPTVTTVVDEQPSPAEQEEVHDLEGIVMDSLPFDALDPFLQIFFAIPKLEDVSNDSSSSSSLGDAASNPTNEIDMEEWQRQLSRERIDSFVPAPALDMQSPNTHWLLKHFPASAIASWKPQLSFT